MSYFNSLTLTTKGQEMLLSSNTNIDKKITFTNASLGSEKLLPEEIKGATEIKNSWLKFPLNTVRIINDENNYFLRTEIAFTNTGITESKIMRELGIYAKFENEEEVLFAYSTTDDDGETIPKEDIVPATYKFTIDTTISTETKINQILNPEGFLTKEVVELLKYYIANIAVQRLKGTLTAGQTIININSEGSLLTTLSKRLQLFIGGELYSEGSDYTVNVENNTIHLNDEFRFEEGTVFEIIDNLPPGYVKELLDEFFKKANDKELEVLKNLEAAQTKNIEAIKILSKQISDFLDEKKITIAGDLDKKIEKFYLDLDTYIEKNKEKLKGKSLYQSWLDIGNIGSESDFVIAMKIKGDDGDPGRGIVSTTMRKGEGKQRIMTILYTDDTTNELIVEDGQSAYEVWKSDGNTGTTADFFKSLEGRGLEYSWRGTELGVRVKGDVEYTFVDLKGDTGGRGPTGGDGPPGKGLYEYWLELGNEGTEEEFVNSFKPVGVVDKRFIGKNDNGDYIYRDVYSDGSESSEYLSPRGPRGYTGGTVGGEEPPPGNVPYGTIVEHGGTNIPSGWALCNGGTLAVGKYPHLIGELPHSVEPTSTKYQFSSEGKVIQGNYENVGTDHRYKKGSVICGGNSFTTEFYRYFSYGNEGQNGLNLGLLYNGITSRYQAYGTRLYKSATVPDKTDRYCYGFLSTLEHESISFYPKALAIDGYNLEFGGLLPEENTNNVGGYNKNLHPDIYINIDYMDEFGDWMLGCQLHNKTDFVKSTVLDNMYIAAIPNSFKTKKIRLSIDPKSTPHYPSSNYYFLGRFHTYLDDIPNRDMTVIKLPNEKDNQGRYKIVYIGQPLETLEPGIYSYSKDNTLNGEVPFSLAVKNEFPVYSEGVTMAEPKNSRMGYINKYNSKSDAWELEKTHENIEGYYYDKIGDLKYIPKPTNYHIWDFKVNNWMEDTLLKEKVKKELLNKYIELQIKKDKMLDLKIDTIDIEAEIGKIKKDLEEING
ncbi:MAG: phage tail protein [Cetobacterium sp.]